jgi:hypothetical protein
MRQATKTLELLRVARPCAVGWGAMRDDGGARFCSACDRHVHDLSLMTRAEIAALAATTGGRFCGRLSRLPDGTLVTSDLFSPRRGPKGRAARAAGAALAALLGLAADAAAQTPAPPEASRPGRPPYVLKREEKPGARVLGIASLRGTLFDVQDAVVAGAEITLREEGAAGRGQEGAGREYKAATDDEGVYFFPSLGAGVYTFEASSPGFEVFRKSGLRLAEGERVTLDVTLQVGATLGEIFVPPPPPPPGDGADADAMFRVPNVLTLPFRAAKKMFGR